MIAPKDSIRKYSSYLKRLKNEPSSRITKDKFPLGHREVEILQSHISPTHLVLDLPADLLERLLLGLGERQPRGDRIALRDKRLLLLLRQQQSPVRVRLKKYSVVSEIRVFLEVTKLWRNDSAQPCKAIIVVVHEDDGWESQRLSRVSVIALNATRRLFVMLL